MTEVEFNRQIERMKATFGERRFPNEFCRLIWERAAKLPAFWFEGCANQIIGSMRPPTLADFVKDAEDWERREKSRNTETDSNVVSLLEKAARRGNSDFGKTCAQLLRDKLAGKYTPEQWEEAMQYLEETAEKLNPGTCARCNGSGYVTVSDLHRCTCSRGRNLPTEITGPKGEKVYVPEWRPT